jgi:hypothetical protein
MAIVIIGIALGVYVIAATARAIRRGGRGGADEDAGVDEDDGLGGDEDGAAEPAEPPGPGLTGADPAYAEPGADTVEREPANEPDAAKEPDEHASTPGRAQRR